MTTEQSSNNPPVSPYIVIAFAILAVSTASIFIRYAQQDASSLVIAAYRLSIASLILAPIAYFRHRDELRRLSRRSLSLALLSGFFLAIHFATWISSLEYTTVASSVVLVSTTPIWVALLSPLTVKESITRAVLVGMLLTLVGGVIVGLSDSCRWMGSTLVCPTWGEFIGGQAFIGDILALIGAIAAAFYLLIGRGLRSTLSLVPYVFVVYGMAAVLLVVTVVVMGLPFTGYTPKVYLWFFLLAVFPQLIGHSTYNWALKYLSAAYVSITLLGEPVGTTILAYILLDEVPSGLKIIGAILILSGIVIASRREQNLPAT